MIVREINKCPRTSANYKYFNGLKHFAASDVELGYMYTHTGTSRVGEGVGEPQERVWFKRHCDV